jgi:thiosulfate dehydrogenase [quinone] large subunit
MLKSLINYKTGVYNTLQITSLTALRLAIGWHFFYEGLSKLMAPVWTSAPFLADSNGLFAPYFQAIPNRPSLLVTVDQLNMWGLTLIGASLMLGLFSRLGTMFGILILALYYLSHPPLAGLEYALSEGGNVLVVNKVLVELLAMSVLFSFPTGKKTGLDRLIFGSE